MRHTLTSTAKYIFTHNTGRKAYTRAVFKLNALDGEFKDFLIKSFDAKLD